MTDLEEANTKGTYKENGLKYFWILIGVILFCWFGPMIFSAIVHYIEK